jgi:hypothetical protein
MSPPKKGWIGVDLDGTLATYDGWHGETHIGAPVPAMVERVKRWLAEGREVRVFTARASTKDIDEWFAIQNAVSAWTHEHVGEGLAMTHEKDFDMIELWDDRAVAVEPNTGRALNPSRRGLD